MKRSKRRYIAIGVLVSLSFSFVFEGYALMSGQDKFFDRSISGLNYSYILLPLFLAMGYIGGYLYWFFVKSKLN